MTAFPFPFYAHLSLMAQRDRTRGWFLPATRQGTGFIGRGKDVAGYDGPLCAQPQPLPDTPSRVYSGSAGTHPKDLRDNALGSYPSGYGVVLAIFISNVGSAAAYLEGKRDSRSDSQRGYAFFAMTLTHLGLASPLNTINGVSAFPINATEVFFFNSGNTMEYIAVDPTLGQQVRSRLSRTSLNYRYVLLFSFLLNLIPWQSDLEWFSQRQAIDFSENVI